jgi:hypothetical protein
MQTLKKGQRVGGMQMRENAKEAILVSNCAQFMAAKSALPATPLNIPQFSP